MIGDKLHMDEYLEQLSAAYDGLLIDLGIMLLILYIGRYLAKILRKLTPRLLERTNLDNRLATRIGRDDPAAMNENIALWVFRLIRLAALVIASDYAYNSIPLIKNYTDAVVEFWFYFIALKWVIFIFDLFLAYLVTLVFLRILNNVKILFEKFYQIIEGWRGTRIKTLKFQKLELLTADRLTDISVLAARYLRILVVILVGLVYLSIVFSFFPQTRGMVDELLTNIIAAIGNGWQAFVDYLPSLLNLVLIFFITRYLLRFIHFLALEVEKGSITLSGFYPEWALPTYQIVRILLITLAIVISYPSLPGAQSEAFQGLSIFFGLLFSLGSTSVIANIVAGIVLTYTRAFSIGDRVKIADTVGDVIERTLLITRVKTIKNVEITVPNGMVLGSHIINYSAIAKSDGLVLHTTITLGYDIPWRQVHEVLIDAALSTEHILQDPKPFVLQTSLDDFYVSYEINAFTDQPNKMALIYSSLHQNIQDKCNENGIEILSPHYRVDRPGAESTIPKEYWKDK